MYLLGHLHPTHSTYIITTGIKYCFSFNDTKANIKYYYLTISSACTRTIVLVHKHTNFNYILKSFIFSLARAPCYLQSNLPTILQPLLPYSKACITFALASKDHT